MTIKTLMTTSALSLLLATSVVAQTATGTTAPSDGTAPMATDAETAAPQDLSGMTVGDLNGTDVVDATGDTIGTIKDVVQGPDAGEAIVGIGGFLGLGQYEVALPLSDLSYDAEAEAIAVTLTREELEAKPEYDAAGRESLPADTQLVTLMGEESGASSSMSDAPASDAPADDALELDAPVSEAPAMEAPETDGAATDAPMNNAPVTDTPVTDETRETGTDTDSNTTTD